MLQFARSELDESTPDTPPPEESQSNRLSKRASEVAENMEEIPPPIEKRRADSKAEGGVTDSRIANGAGLNLDSANRALMLELLASMSPEFSFDDTTEHIVRLSREFFGVDRVGFFLVDLEKGLLILKLTQEGTSLDI